MSALRRPECFCFIIYRNLDYHIRGLVTMLQTSQRKARWREREIIYKSHMTLPYMENKDEKQKKRETPERQEYFISKSSKLLL